MDQDRTGEIVQLSRTVPEGFDEAKRIGFDNALRQIMDFYNIQFCKFCHRSVRRTASFCDRCGRSVA